MLDNLLTEDDVGGYFLTGLGEIVRIDEVQSNGRAFEKPRGYVRTRRVLGLAVDDKGFRLGSMRLYTLRGTYNETHEGPNDMVQSLTKAQAKGVLALSESDDKQVHLQRL